MSDKSHCRNLLVSALVLAFALLTGFGLRTIRLDSVPPGFFCDEALFGYDAYSILKTGRDHHGNFLPIMIQGFNTYNMPLFCYSLVPLVAALGLKPAVVRLGIALWGCADLAAIAVLAGLAFGLEGAAVAALLGALSPWHLSYSRFAQEVMTAPAMVDAAMVCFFLWLRHRRDRWLLLSGLFFALSLYSYSITKIFVPAMIVLLASLYWRELRPAVSRLAVAVTIVLVFALPQIIMMHRHPETLALVRRSSVFNLSGSFLSQAAQVGSNWIAYFTPSYLFRKGERYGLISLWRPPHYFMLLPEQAVLIVLGLTALLHPRRRRLVVLLIGWLLLGTLPGALTMLPPHLARRGILAVAPWTLLSALGFVTLVELTSGTERLRAVAVSLIAAGVLFHGGQFIRAYFWKFPRDGAVKFRYGLEEAMRDIDRFNDRREPVIIPDLDKGYMYVLFFERYPPERFQHEQVSQFVDGHVRRSSGSDLAKTPPGAPVLAFGQYLFENPGEAYKNLKHGIFVFPGDEQPPAPPALSVRSPYGTIAFKILVK